jgi:hypothetical protein
MGDELIYFDGKPTGLYRATSLLLARGMSWQSAYAVLDTCERVPVGFAEREKGGEGEWEEWGGSPGIGKDGKEHQHLGGYPVKVKGEGKNRTVVDGAVPDEMIGKNPKDAKEILSAAGKTRTKTGHPEVDKALKEAKTPAGKLKALHDNAHHLATIVNSGHDKDIKTKVRKVVEGALQGTRARDHGDMASSIGIKKMGKAKTVAEKTDKIAEHLNNVIESHSKKAGEGKIGHEVRADARDKLKEAGYKKPGERAKAAPKEKPAPKEKGSREKKSKLSAGKDDEKSSTPKVDQAKANEAAMDLHQAAKDYGKVLKNANSNSKDRDREAEWTAPSKALKVASKLPDDDHAKAAWQSMKKIDPKSTKGHKDVETKADLVRNVNRMAHAHAGEKVKPDGEKPAAKEKPANTHPLMAAIAKKKAEKAAGSSEKATPKSSPAERPSGEKGTKKAPDHAAIAGKINDMVNEVHKSGGHSGPEDAKTAEKKAHEFGNSGTREKMEKKLNGLLAGTVRKDHEKIGKHLGGTDEQIKKMSDEKLVHAIRQHVMRHVNRYQNADKRMGEK